MALEVFSRCAELLYQEAAYLDERRWAEEGVRRNTSAKITPSSSRTKTNPKNKEVPYDQAQ
jgi:hypothetical protein